MTNEGLRVGDAMCGDTIMSKRNPRTSPFGPKKASSAHEMKAKSLSDAAYGQGRSGGSAK